MKRRYKVILFLNVSLREEWAWGPSDKGINFARGLTTDLFIVHQHLYAYLYFIINFKI